MKAISKVISAAAVSVLCMIYLVGCKNNPDSLSLSSEPKKYNKNAAEEKSVNDTVAEKADSSNNQQTHPQSKTDSQLPDNIDTAKSPFEKGYYDYQGTINSNMLIQMSVYPLEKEIVGSYFYDSQKKEINLKGKAGENNIVLNEYDETGENTGIFKGTMKTVDKIEGTWVSGDNKTSYPFTLSLKSILPGVEYGKRYSTAVGTVSDDAVEDFAGKIQSYIVNDSKKQLAEVINYPINAKIDGKVTKIENEENFIKNYNKIFHPDYRKSISEASAKYMFANYLGVMLGTGSYNIWFNVVTPAGSNSKLMITAINN